AERRERGARPGERFDERARAAVAKRALGGPGDLGERPHAGGEPAGVAGAQRVDPRAEIARPRARAREERDEMHAARQLHALRLGRDRVAQDAAERARRDVDAAAAALHLGVRLAGARENRAPDRLGLQILPALRGAKRDRRDERGGARAEPELHAVLLQLRDVDGGGIRERGASLGGALALPFERVRVAIDRHHDRGRAFEHGVRAGEDELSRRRDAHHETSVDFCEVPPAADPSTILAAGPGRASITRRTPGIASSTARTASASALETSTLTCGPASLVAYAAAPSARSARTRLMSSMVMPRM